MPILIPMKTSEFHQRRSGMLPVLLCLLASLTPARAAEETTELTLTAPATFQIKDGFTRLLISDGSVKFSLSWAVQQPGQELTRYYPVTLQPGETYTFTLYNLPNSFAVQDGREKALMETMFRRVQSGDKVLYDREVCALHHTKMEWRDVPIIYGLVGKTPGQPTWEIERKLFPNRHEAIFAGCIVGPEKTQKTLVCAECRAAYDAWKKEQPVK
jgi:hypothetical protein